MGNTANTSPFRNAVLVIYGLSLVFVIASMCSRLWPLRKREFQTWPLTQQLFFWASISSIVCLTVGAIALPFGSVEIANFEYFTGTVKAASLLIALVLGVKASIYRYCRIFVVLKGTKRYNVMKGLLYTAYFLSIFTFISTCINLFIDNGQPEQYLRDFITLPIFNIALMLFGSYIATLDISLSWTMSKNVIESVRKDKVAKFLVPKLVATLIGIVIGDALSIGFAFIGSDDSIGLITSIALVHLQFSFLLLVMLQNGLKLNKKNSMQSAPITELSSVRLEDIKSQESCISESDIW